MIDILCADVMDWAAGYDGEPYHALLSDPPYELGFMGKDWDRSGIAFNPDTWAALAEHLHPGAFGMAFASSRGWHRLAVAIEDAGLRIHPSIFGWGYGSGFPKATRIDTQVDKAAGAEREVVGIDKGKLRRYGSQREERKGEWQGNGWNGLCQNPIRASTITAPATPLAQSWQSHRYGLQALKPALEPIIVFQKPYDCKPVDCITRTGAGSLNIDRGRIGVNGNDVNHREPCDGKNNTGSSGIYNQYNQIKRGDNLQPQGRWPANLVLSHSPDCERVGSRKVKGSGTAVKRNKDNSKLEQGNVYGDYRQLPANDMTYADPDGTETVADWECVEDCPVRRLGEQSGERVSTRWDGGGWSSDGSHEGWKRPAHKEYKAAGGYDDKGTASHFFYNADHTLNQLESSDPLFYCAKASRAERDAGLGEFNEQEVQTGCGGGDFPVDDQGRQRNRFKSVVRNPHPTIKPLTLTKWLSTLLLPPPAYSPRRLLVPFCGTMSEGIGAHLAGWEHITGIDSDPATIDIASPRVKWWQGWAAQSSEREPKMILKMSKKADRKNGKVRQAVLL